MACACSPISIGTDIRGFPLQRTSTLYFFLYTVGYFCSFLHFSLAVQCYVWLTCMSIEILSCLKRAWRWSSTFSEILQSDFAHFAILSTNSSKFTRVFICNASQQEVMLQVHKQVLSIEVKKCVAVTTMLMTSSVCSFGIKILSNCFGSVEAVLSTVPAHLWQK